MLGFVNGMLYDEKGNIRPCSVNDVMAELMGWRSRIPEKERLTGTPEERTKAFGDSSNPAWRTANQREVIYRLLSTIIHVESFLVPYCSRPVAIGGPSFVR